MFAAVHQMDNVWPVRTTSGLESSGPSGLVILSLLGSAMSLSTVDYKRKTAKIVAVHEVRWWVTCISINMYKIIIFKSRDNLYLHSRNIFKCQGDKITHFHVHIMHA